MLTCSNACLLSMSLFIDLFCIYISLLHINYVAKIRIWSFSHFGYGLSVYFSFLGPTRHMPLHMAHPCCCLEGCFIFNFSFGPRISCSKFDNALSGSFCSSSLLYLERSLFVVYDVHTTHADVNLLNCCHVSKEGSF